MSDSRSPNLPPLSLEDIFDKTPAHAVMTFSEDIQYAIQKQAANGMTANIMFTVLSFFVANMMQDIQYEAKARQKEKELKEEETRV